MTSKIISQQTHNNFPYSKQRDQQNQNLLEIIRKPRERIQKLLKTQSEIIDMLTKSTKLQYSSFQSKYVAFNQILDNFKALDQVQYEKLFNVYARTDKKSNAEQVDFPQAIEEMHQSSSLSERKNVNMKKQVKKKETILASQKNQEKVIERKQPVKKPQTRQMTQKRKIMKEDNSMNKNNLDQESNYGQREEKGRKIQRKETNNRYQQKRRDITERIKNNMKFPNQFNKVGELLTLPYSILQMLISYNEAARY